MQFYKYQGAGNDFVMLDGFYAKIHLTETEISKICDRKFGIGADGLIIIQKHPDYDFEMLYYNSDGKLGSMCGNGGRCAVKFALDLNLIKSNSEFLGPDGPHKAEVKSDSIKISMKNMEGIVNKDNAYILDTGSPHYILFSENCKDIDVKSEGRAIRYSEDFSEKGINVNFVEEISDNELFVRTYERGVEDETLSCGTGVTASALSLLIKKPTAISPITINTLGGNLRVYADHNMSETDPKFSNIWLEGPAEKVFFGEINF